MISIMEASVRPDVVWISEMPHTSYDFLTTSLLILKLTSEGC